jgi:hypothetical protein
VPPPHKRLAAAAQALRKLEPDSDELKWLQRTFPACIAHHIISAVESQPHFTILVLQRLVPHKAMQVHGQQNFEKLCR